jgi:hypothetical protein
VTRLPSLVPRFALLCRRKYFFVAASVETGGLAGLRPMGVILAPGLGNLASHRTDFSGNNDLSQTSNLRVESSNLSGRTAFVSFFAALNLSRADASNGYSEATLTPSARLVD